MFSRRSFRVVYNRISAVCVPAAILFMLVCCECSWATDQGAAKHIRPAPMAESCDMLQMGAGHFCTPRYNKRNVKIQRAPKFTLDGSIGNVSTMASVGVLLPLYGQRREFLAIDARLSFYDEKPKASVGSNAVNVGILYRSMIGDSAAAAFFAYYDSIYPRINTSSVGNYDQFTAGIQMMSRLFDVQATLYMPSDINKIVLGDRYRQIGGDTDAEFYRDAYLLHTARVFDIEAGFHIIAGDDAVATVYVGAYNFDVFGADSFGGARARVELYERFHSAKFSIGVALQSDNVRGVQYSSFLRMDLDATSWRSLARISPLERRVAEPIRRDNVPTFIVHRYEQLVDEALFIANTAAGGHESQVVPAIFPPEGDNVEPVFPSIELPVSTSLFNEVVSGAGMVHMDVDTLDPQEAINSAGEGAIILLHGDIELERRLDPLPGQILVGMVGRDQAHIAGTHMRQLGNGFLRPVFIRSDINSDGPAIALGNDSILCGVVVDSSVVPHMPAVEIRDASNVALIGVDLVSGHNSSALVLDNSTNVRVSSTSLSISASNAHDDHALEATNPGVTIRDSRHVDASGISIKGVADGFVGIKIDDSSDIKLSGVNISSGGSESSDGFIVTNSSKIVMDGMDMVNVGGSGFAINDSAALISNVSTDYDGNGTSMGMLFDIRGESNIKANGVRGRFMGNGLVSLSGEHASAEIDNVSIEIGGDRAMTSSGLVKIDGSKSTFVARNTDIKTSAAVDSLFMSIPHILQQTIELHGVKLNGKVVLGVIGDAIIASGALNDSGGLMDCDDVLVRCAQKQCCSKLQHLPDYKLGL